MDHPITFATALEAVEQLDPDAQAELVAVLSRRLAERGRERLAAVVAEAEREYAAGECKVMTAAEIVREAQFADIQFTTEDEQSDDPTAIEKWIADLEALPAVPWFDTGIR